MSGGGSGTIDRELANGLRCNDRTIGLRVDASPVEIFYNLGMDRVHYVPQDHFLYFAASKHFPVLRTIESVFCGLDAEPEVEQLFLDVHGYYKGAQRVRMTSQQAHAVLVALRLKGIKISIAEFGSEPEIDSR